MNNGKITKAQLEAAMLGGTQLATYKVPYRAKLIGSWMRAGDFGIVFAWRGVGKTWFALSMSDSLIHSKPLGPWPAGTLKAENRVLYLDGEMPAQDIKSRAKLLGLLDTDRFVLLNHEILFQQCQKDLNLTNFEQQELLTNICVEQNHNVMILDNLSSLFTNLQEDKADDWDQYVKPWLLDLRRRMILVILLCHSGKNLKIRGTSKKEDMVFWSIDLFEDKQAPAEKGKTQCKFVSHFTKTRNDPIVAHEDYLWTLTTDYNPSVYRTTVEHEPYGTPQKILILIRKGFTSCGDIAKELELTPGRVSQIVNEELIPRGLVEKAGRNYYPVQHEKA